MFFCDINYQKYQLIAKMIERDKDVSLDQITQVINKLEGKLKDDRLSQQLRNSNVTIDQKPIRIHHQFVNQIPTNYHSMRQQVIYQNYPQQAQTQFGYSSRTMVPQPQNIPYQLQRQINQQSGLTYINQKGIPQNRPNQMQVRIKNLEDKLKQYEKFQLSVKQNNIKNEEQFEKLINVINYQQNEIVLIESQNNQIQHQLRQALETQKIYEEELAMYKHKVVGLQRTLNNNSGKGVSQVVSQKNSKNEIFKDMMRNIDSKNRVGSPRSKK